jgi:hypothetical protein
LVTIQHYRRLVEDLMEENSGLLLPDQYFIGSSKVLLKDDQVRTAATFSPPPRHTS